MAIINGTGATITFGTSAYAAPVLRINGSGITRATIDTSHLASTTMTFIPGDLLDNGTVEVEVIWDPDAQPPVDQDAETVTIEFASTLATGAQVSGSAFVTDWEWTNPLEDRVTASFTLKWAGAVTWTDATA